MSRHERSYVSGCWFLAFLLRALPRAVALAALFWRYVSAAVTGMSSPLALFAAVSAASPFSRLYLAEDAALFFAAACSPVIFVLPVDWVYSLYFVFLFVLAAVLFASSAW